MRCSPWKVLTCPRPKPVVEPHTGYRGKKQTKQVTKAEGKQAPEFSPIPIVFNLCRNPESGERFVEEYSGYSGYHIRTIPGRRWRNPVFVASGQQYVAVLDRFNNLDMVRITDKFGGAGESAFDEDGFPLDSVDWENVGDDFSVTLPTGFVATGLCVVERGTVLVNMTGPDSQLYVYRYQIGEDLGIIDSLIAIPGYGTAIGAPLGLYSRPGEQMYLAASIVQNESGQAVLVYDWLDIEPVAMMGLPDGWTGVSLGEGNNVLAVLIQQGPSSRIMRFPLNIYTSIASGGVRGDTLPQPGDVEMTQTFMPLDAGYQEGDLLAYNRLTQAANRDFGRIGTYPQPSSSEISDLQQGGRPLASGQTSGSLNDNREQVFEDYQCTYYGQTITLRGNFIDNPSSTSIIGLSGCFGAVCEFITTDNQERPVFRLVEAKNYDYLADGGFVYGCEVSGDGNGVTSGYTTISVSVDVGYERGALKDLPDVKVALVDALTGGFIFQPLKPFLNAADGNRAYRLYSGEYASLQAPAESTIKRSGCSSTLDATAQDIDGIVRPGHTRPTDDPGPPQFTLDTTDLDAPWAFFIRRGILGSKPVLAPATASWSVRESDGILLWPEWRDTVGIASIQDFDQLFWPPVSANVAETAMQTSCRSGFFVPNYPKEQTTTHQYANDQIAKLEAANASGSLTPEQIAANNDQIAAYQNQIATTDDDPYFVIPDSILNVRFPRIEGSKAQEIESPLLNNDFDQSDAVEIPPLVPTDPPLTPWSVVAIPGLNRQGQEEADLRRGAVISPNIRSWIGVDVKLDRLGSLTQGVTGFRNQAYWNNGLGKNVGGNDFAETGDIVNPTCHDLAFAYEAGYTAGDGALGSWEVDILLNDRPASAMATRVTFPEQILQQAPLDAHSVLMNTLQATGGVGLLGYHKGRVYYTDQIIRTVTIRARLVNYSYGVYRVGYRTVHRNDSGPYVTDSFCPGADPGFFAKAACGDCCGNVSCTSFIFFGNKLFSDDPIYPRTRQVVWAGEATYTVDADPYATNYNLSLGRLIDAYFEFQLNNTIAAYSVDISKNQ